MPLIFGIAVAATATEAPSATESMPSTAALIEKMAAARALVAVHNVRISHDGTNAVIAVWSGASEDPIRVVELRSCRTSASDLAVECRRYTRSSVEYVVTAPANTLVLAAKTRTCIDHRCRRTQTATQTPYAAMIHTPGMVAVGRRYLDSLVLSAKAELDKLETPSLAVPGSRVTDLALERILAAIPIVEHGRSDQVEELGIRHVVEEFLVFLAANGENAFAGTISRANARGIAQFISSSYQLTRTRYKNAQLIADFRSGTDDHLNAVKAQFCLADWTLTELSSESLAKLRIPLFEEDLGAYIAAAYNGGEHRAARAHRRYPESWEKSGRGLFRETIGYVNFFRLVYRQLWIDPDIKMAATQDRTFDP